MVWPKWVRWMLAFACLFLVVGCDATKPEKFAGFATEQLSEQIEIVSAKLNESIESNQQAQNEILSAVRDLSQTVAGMKLASQKEIEELKKVSGKVKTKLTSAGDEKKDVATLDPNAAPSAKLELDSLDDAAVQISALASELARLEKKIKELDERCQCGKLSSSSKPSSAPVAEACYKDADGNWQCPMKAPATKSAVVSSPVVTSYSYQSYSGNSTGNSFSGNSNGSSYQVYQSPGYSVQYGSSYATPTTDYSPLYFAAGAAVGYQVQQYRTGLFGRKIPVR